jgi:hypothetical protein
MIYGSGIPQFADEYALSETDPAHIRAARKRSLFDKSKGGTKRKPHHQLQGIVLSKITSADREA